MPSVLIEVRTSYPRAQEAALVEAVHAALVSAFRILPGDRYTHVSIDAFAGRSLDAKRVLYRAIVENLAALGVPTDHVKILLRELPRESWGIRGGQAACDVDLGFKVDV